jgi:colanic acid biosynthesis glycosyl transferase WcaI
MRILIVTAYYRPDGGPAAPLYTMLSEELVRRGHDVTVITSVPHYPSGLVPLSYRKKRFRYTKENGVCIIRVPLPSVNRSDLKSRLLQYGAFQLGSVWAGRMVQFDVVLSHSSALETWLPLMFFAVLRKKPAIYSIHDMYPNIGVKMGIFRQNWIIKLVGMLEKSCIDHARRVRILSQSFFPELQRLNIPESKIVLIYDWVETDAIKPLPRDNRFARNHGLAEWFTVLYAGNLGLPQGLETLIRAAHLLRGVTGLRFVLIGDGAARQSLMELVAELKLGNVSFLPYQPREYMPEVLASADIALVSLKRGTGIGALPSKTFGIMASGRPVIAAVDKGSDTWDLVQRSRSGLCIEPEDPEQLAEAVLVLKCDALLREELGQNGRAYALSHHSVGSAADAFERIFAEIKDMGFGQRVSSSNEK